MIKKKTYKLSITKNHKITKYFYGVPLKVYVEY